MSPDKPAPPRRALKPACDQCHTRRVKCSHEQPCSQCVRHGFGCSYTKASKAKKSAGKRIEALRQADQRKGIAASTQDDRHGDSEMHLSSSSSQPAFGSGHWSQSNAAAGPSSIPSSSSFSHPSEGRSYGGDGRPSPQGYSMPLSSPYSRPSPGASFSRSQSMSWAGPPAPSPRTRGSYEDTRQVRFQPSSARASASYERAHSGAGGYRSSFDAPHAELGSHSQSQPYSQSSIGSSMPGPSYGTGAHYPPNGGQASGGGGIAYGQASGEPGNPLIPFPNSVTFGIDGAEMPAADLLQSSTLPPFSTSMADSLFTEQGAFNAESFFSESAMLPLVANESGQPTVLDLLGSCLPSGETPGSSTSGSAFDNPRGMTSSESSMYLDAPTHRRATSSHSHDDFADDGGPLDDKDEHPLSDSVLIPTLALFYERLGGVMPVFSRTWLFSKMDDDHHLKDQHFAAMLLAMSALTIIQAQPNSDSRERKATRMSSRRRRIKAFKLLEEALKMRESPLMGQSVSLEQCCTSFFVFATLFGLGEHLAGWYRLRESITIAHLCRLHEPGSYENLAKDEAERRLRMYWLLAITERAFAIQSRMPIVLTGNPRASTDSLRKKLGVSELSDFPDLQLKLFDVVDEKFVDCWNQKCQGAACRNFDRDRAIALWRAFTDGIQQPSGASSASNKDRSPADDAREESQNGPASSPLTTQFGSARPRLPTRPVERSQIQKADVEVTRHWLLNRLYLITLNHGLLSLDARDPPLRIDHAIHVAQSALDVCNDHLSLPSMEAHGIGFTYKLFDIAQTLVLLCDNEGIADAISKRGQLEKQTTVAHTSGRPHIGRDRNGSADSSQLGSDPGSAGYPGMFDLQGRTLPPLYSNDLGPAGSMRGPASLRYTVLNILNDYLTLFQRFRGGDHPYLEKLSDLIDELKKKGNVPGPGAGMPQAFQSGSMRPPASAQHGYLGGSQSMSSPSRAYGLSPLHGQAPTPSSSSTSSHGMGGGSIDYHRTSGRPHGASISSFMSMTSSPRTRSESTTQP